MRVFLDTNVLVSAFATRGLCSDVLRHVLSEHELIVGEVILEELRRVLRDRIKLPSGFISAVEQLLREQEVVPRPHEPSGLAIRDESNRWVLASALEGRADVLVTGDRDLLDIASQTPLTIVDPRGYWSFFHKNHPKN
ncbi:MAG: putative toxin-antitoxin system toxin component, PIN family [Terriglobia bacterium]